MTSKTQTETKTSTNTNGTYRINVITTRGQRTTFEANSKKWSDIKEILINGGTDVYGKSFNSYDLSNMKVAEGTNKSTLEHPDAIIPDGDINLFLMPIKSKSGATKKNSPKKKAAPKKAVKKAAVKKSAKSTKTTTAKSEVISSVVESLKGKPQPDTSAEDIKELKRMASGFKDVNV